MRVERRKHERVPCKRPAFLWDGSRKEPCSVVNVSAGGAKVALDQPMTLPESFVLALTLNGKVARRCRMVWQSSSGLGVEFQGVVSMVAHASGEPVAALDC
jgi:hypothetical protein